jgi:hypothetical protein
MSDKISIRAARILAAIEGHEGEFIRVSWSTVATPAAAHRGVELRKHSTATVRSGVSYANLRNVTEAIARGERGEVQPRKWGEWLVRNILLGHTVKGEAREYVALYPINGQRVQVTYTVDGVQVDRESFASYLRKSDADKMGQPLDVFPVDVRNVLSVGDRVLAA